MTCRKDKKMCFKGELVMDKAMEKLMNSINNKKEKTQKIKVKSEQKIIKNNFALCENTFTENEYIKIPLLESK